ncbi:MAG: hypothetical protein EOP46_09140 [Sphingobacteriaceae bacterium]|nr:MAG: hypothetical protein EOP46_09140 [Sphingobacteriaceae bacterium]
MRITKLMMVLSIFALAIMVAGCQKEKFTSRDTSSLKPPPPDPEEPEEPEEPVDPTLVLWSGADAADGWSTVGEPRIEAAGKKEGTGFIQNTIADGSDFMQFIYKPAAAFNTNLSADNGQFTFWWYLSDPSILKEDGQIEINSSGDFDKEEYGWSIAALKPTLKAGWNEIKLNFNRADKAGGDFNPAAVKQFRVFFWTETSSHAELVTGVDGLMFRQAPPTPAAVFDSADAADGWETVGSVNIETVGKKEGTGYIKNTIANGGDFMQFIKKVDPPVNSTFTMSTGVFTFWWYVDDPSILKADGQIEINSNGNFDQNEIHWNVADVLPSLKPGWNELKLKFSEAVVEGGEIDLTAIKQFRIFFWTQTAAHPDLVTGVDGFKFIEVQ